MPGVWFTAPICRAILYSEGEVMAKKPAAADQLQQLKADIRSRNPGRLYIFHGEEVFLLHHYFEQIRKLLLDDLTPGDIEKALQIPVDIVKSSGSEFIRGLL